MVGSRGWDHQAPVCADSVLSICRCAVDASHQVLTADDGDWYEEWGPATFRRCSTRSHRPGRLSDREVGGEGLTAPSLRTTFDRGVGQTR